MTPAVRVTGLRRAFGAVQALDGVDREVPEHTLFGIVGPDGAGKTTLLRLLVGVLQADAGHIEVLGRDAASNRDELRLMLGYMSQRFSLYEDLSVAENIKFFGSLRGVSRTDREARAQRVLEATGLAPFTERFAGKLSGGMKQKLGLVCTLVHEPQVLFLDEPTNGVDPVSRREFWSILGELRQRITVVVATPGLDEAARCDRVALMAGGKVLVSDTPANLRSRVHEPVWEVEVEDPFRAAEELGAAMPAASVELFGDRVHVVAEVDRGAIVEVLRSVGLPSEARRVEPTLEDAYVRIVQGAA